MKRIMTLLLVVLLGISLCSCVLKEESMMKNKDRRTADKQLQMIMDAIQTHDREKLLSLFTEDSYYEANKSDETVEELFDYFRGEIKELDDWGGPYVETSRENDYIIQIAESTYDIKTTVSEYRFAIRYIIQDTKNPQNIGVESLYIIRTADDTDTSYAYWGDGTFAPGIHIGIPNSI